MSNEKEEFTHYKNKLFSNEFRAKVIRLDNRLDRELTTLYESLSAKYEVILNNIEYIPKDLLNKINSSYSRLLATLDSLFMTIETGKPIDKEYLKILSNDIRNYTDSWWSLVIPYVHADMSLVNRVKKDLEDEKEKAVDANEKIENLKNKLEQEIKDFQERYNDSFRDAELEKQTSNLSTESNRNKTTSYWWLLFITLGVIGFLFAFYCLFKTFCFEKECFLNSDLIELNKVCSTCGASVLYYEIAKALLFRVVLLSGILYIIAFGIKNYNAAMHNYTINAHRANALDAAQRLIGRANTDGAKDEILKLAAQAIFAYQKTGHLDKEAEPSNPNIVMDKIIDKINKA